MGNIPIIFLIVLFICLSARALAWEFTRPRIVFRQPQHSVQALRIGHRYRVFAWAVLTIYLLSEFISIL